MFAEARSRFFIPPGVAYCNTGTLGASPRDVVSAVVTGMHRIEADLADWPYEQPDGEPLTGYQPLLHVRADFIDRIGMPRIARWDSGLTARLREGLAAIPRARLSSPAHPELGAAIRTFRVEGLGAKALQDALWKRPVRVRAQSDDRGVRLSAHLYVSPADIDIVLIDIVLTVVETAARR